MGKRKERRLAAKMAASRRVKLDLFAEPPDLGGSPDHDEAGEDMDAKPEAPKSPSLSGQQENPLLLLEQYSDEESEEQSHGRTDQDKALTDKDEKAEDISGKEWQHKNDNTREDISSHEGKAQDLSISSPATTQIEDVNTNGCIDSVASDVNKGVDLVKSTLIDSISDSKSTGDLYSIWEMVLDEESNEYYYWNTETGETSWEVPDAFSDATGIAGTGATFSSEEKGTAATICSTPLVPFGGTVESANQGGPEVNNCAEIYAVDGNKLLNGSIVVSSTYQDNSGVENYLYQTTLAGYGNSLTSAGSQQVMLGNYANKVDAVTTDLPSQLVRRSERLLEILKSRMGLHNDFQQHDLGSKCILEIEIRLSDFKSLLPYGSSVDPFWVHSEMQIRRLEQTTDNLFGMCTKSEEKRERSDVKAPSLAAEGEACEVKKQEPDVDAKNRDNLKVSSQKSLVSVGEFDMNVAEKPSYDTTHDKSVIAELHTVIESSEIVSEHRTFESEKAAVTDANSKAKLELNEDIDMDVDMEVEDIEQHKETGDHAPSLEQFVQPSPPTQTQQQTLGDQLVPLLPEEEWIPPPPPDDESIPPPPPDEPPPDDPSTPSAPCFPEPMLTFSHTAGYSSTYLDPNFTYYGGTISDASSSYLYGHVQGFPSSVSASQMYYAAVSNTQPQEVVVMANPVESTVYLSLEDRMLPTVPGVTTVESSCYHMASASMGYDSLLSAYKSTLNPMPDFSTCKKIGVDASAHGSGVDEAPRMVSAPAAVVSAPSTISADENVSAASTSNLVPSSIALSSTTISGGSSATAAKGPSKALRSKKRAVSMASSLKSNKKVSSLVDKWKAAKEQMHDEEEEEPETALEILEKKRQREIEEWRSQQLASGEAEENANFQPLGGDWRERVKRRREQKKASEETSAVVNDVSSKRPDLTDFYRDLPPGWQAYWDESSRQVYYGNVITSETTWSKPTS